MSSVQSPANPASSYLDSRYSWFRLFVATLISIIGNVAMWAVVIVLPTVQHDFGIARSDASIPYTATMMGFALGNLLFGRLVDRRDIAYPLMAAALLQTAGFGLGALTGNIWTFALAGCIAGIGSAISYGPLIADISHWFSRHRGIAVGIAASGNYFAGAIWPLILKEVIEIGDWRDAYFLIAVVAFVTIIPLAMLLRRRLPSHVFDSPTGGGPAEELHQIDISKRLLLLLLCIAGVSCCVAMAMPQVHIVAYCVDLGFSVSTGAEILSLMIAGGVVSRLFSGFLADHIGGVRTLLLGSFLQCLALFLYIPFDGLTSLFIVSAVFGLSQGGIVPGYAIIIREYLPAREAGEQVGLVIMMTVIGMALGGWMSGFIYDMTGSYQAAFINGIAWNMLNVGIMALLLWRTREGRHQAV